MVYGDIECQILALSVLGAEVFEIGKTILGRSIYCVRVGSSFGPKIIVQYSIHAREHITTHLAIRHIKDAIESRGELFGQIYFVPCLNPDGVALALEGESSVANKSIKKFLLNVNKSNDFSLWKANALAVDLNVNFDARWAQGTQNKLFPSPSDYVGLYPNSEREVNAIIELTEQIKPKLTISYHSKGEEIYYKFGQSNAELRRDKEIATRLSLLTGYPLRDAFGSVGGYKDWCISKLKIPAFTFEVGKDTLKHPIYIEHLDDIYNKNKDIPKEALKLALNL